MPSLSEIGDLSCITYHLLPGSAWFSHGHTLRKSCEPFNEKLLKQLCGLAQVTGRPEKLNAFFDYFILLLLNVH